MFLLSWILRSNTRGKRHLCGSELESEVLRGERITHSLFYHIPLRNGAVSCEKMGETTLGAAKSRGGM